MVIYAIKAVLKACISSNFVAEAESKNILRPEELRPLDYRYPLLTIAHSYKEKSQCKITPV